MKRTTDFSNYHFRCHSIGKIMVGTSKVGLTAKQKETLANYEAKIESGKGLTAKQEETRKDLIAKRDAPPTLSATTKTFLKSLHKQEVFNRRKEIISKYLDKGVQVEEQAITLYSQVCNQFFVKNTERFTNEYLTGEPDNVQGIVRDIKSSWDLDTFPMYEDKIPNTDYYWQLQAYMALTGLNEAELVYCLIDTPIQLIEDEKRRISWKNGMMELPEDMEEEIERNMTYDDIPPELKIKVFKLQRNDKAIKEMYEQIKLCREYLNSLSEGIADRVKLTEAA